jgi:hypothetical protein
VRAAGAAWTSVMAAAQPSSPSMRRTAAAVEAMGSTQTARTGRARPGGTGTGRSSGQERPPLLASACPTTRTREGLGGRAPARPISAGEAYFRRRGLFPPVRPISAGEAFETGLAGGRIVFGGLPVACMRGRPSMGTDGPGGKDPRRAPRNSVRRVEEDSDRGGRGFRALAHGAERGGHAMACHAMPWLDSDLVEEVVEGLHGKRAAGFARARAGARAGAGVGVSGV